MPMRRELRSEWAKHYHSKMGSAEVVAPPPADLIRLYHLTSAEFAVSNIVFGRVKIAIFQDLNDPFELLSPNFKDKVTRKIIHNFKKEYGSHTGLLCFSGNWTNPVLWSHYGAKHHGICLGFDLERKPPKRVVYQDERIVTNFGGLSSKDVDKNLSELLLCTKFKHWEYEEEYRLLLQLKDAVEEGGLYFHPIGKGLDLKEVILGPLCSLPLNEIRKLADARQPGTTVFKSRLAFKSFDVVPDERSVL